MVTFGLILWWTISAPFIAVQLVAALPISTMSYLVSYTDEGYPVEIPISILQGPRYFSLHHSLPFTDNTGWEYWGDEVEGVKWCPKHERMEPDVDESTWAWRWDPPSEFPRTHSLRGDENFDSCRGSEAYGMHE
jgi:hypothetical protein